MLRRYAAVRESAKHISSAIRGAHESFLDRRAEQEPAITDRLAGRIEQAMDGYTVKGIRWTAKTLTDHGRGAQEKDYGADVMGVLDIDLPELKVSKGFLAQAKRFEPRTGFSQSEFRRLQGQCEKMLAVTPGSFVFLYSRGAFSVVPAVAIAGTTLTRPLNLYSRRLESFYRNHLECFVGDRALSAPTLELLEERRRQSLSRSAVLLSARLA